MARLAEIAEYKKTIGSKLLEDKDLCKAIYYTDTNFLDKPDVLNPNENLLYRNIFPFRFVPETTIEGKTFIAISLGKYGSAGGYYFKSGLMRIDIFTHRELFRTDYGITRVDYIMNKIDEMFNQKRGIGIGKLEFYGMDEYVLNDKYSGIYLSYKPVDFN